jgi:hypothetical protein
MGWYEILVFKLNDKFEWQLGLPGFFLADLADLRAEAMQLKVQWLTWLPHICRSDAEAQAQIEISVLCDHLTRRDRSVKYDMRSEWRFALHMTEEAKKHRYCAHMRYFYLAVAAQCLVLDALKQANEELREQILHILACAQASETPEDFQIALQREPKLVIESDNHPVAPEPELHVYLQLIVVRKYALRRVMVHACEHVYNTWLTRHRYTVYWPSAIVLRAFVDIDKLEGRDRQPPDMPSMQGLPMQLGQA